MTFFNGYTAVLLSNTPFEIDLEQSFVASPYFKGATNNCTATLPRSRLSKRRIASRYAGHREEIFMQNALAQSNRLC